MFAHTAHEDAPGAHGTAGSIDVAAGVTPPQGLR